MVVAVVVMKVYFLSPHWTPGGVILGRCETQIKIGRLNRIGGGS